jgi:hypothetical protein
MSISVVTNAADAPQGYQGEEYWAAADAETLASAVADKRAAYFDALQRRGHIRMWRQAYAQHYGLDPNNLLEWQTQQITLDGEDGELVRYRSNEARSYFMQQITMATGHRPSFQAIATNDDAASLAQVEMSDAAVAYIYESKFGEKKERQVAERAGIFARAWTWIQWDANAGPMIDKQVPTPVRLRDGSTAQHVETVSKRAGDITVKRLSPWEVFFEPFAADDESHMWRCVRERRSKWELAKLYPGHAADLLDSGGTGSSTTQGNAALQMVEGMFGWGGVAMSTDEVIVEHFYHDRCSLIEAGRYAIICGGKALYDGELPYDSLRDALVDLCPSEYIGNAFGYAESWDLIPPNMILDQLRSDIATNLSTFCKPTIFSEEGTDVDWDALAQGHRALKIPRDAKPPQAINFTSVPESAKWFISDAQKIMQSRTGMNSVVRGEPDANISSGQMAALFHSIAMEFNSAWQAAIDGHREGVANAILAVYKLNCDADVMIEIAGNDERQYAKTFKRDRMLGIKRVIVKTANPMLRTAAGRMQVAEYLKTVPGAITTPEQAIEAITTGQVKPLYRATRTELLHIKFENEALAAGKVTLHQAPQMDPSTGQPLPPQPFVTQVPDQFWSPPMNADGSPAVDPTTGQPPQPPMVSTVPSVPVAQFDKHEMHMPEHKAEYYAAFRMGDQAAMQAIVAHVLEHMRAAYAMDPRLAQLLQIHIPAPLSAQPGTQPSGGGGKPPSAANDPPAATQPADPAQLKGGPGLGVTLPKPSESPQPQNQATQ